MNVTETLSFGAQMYNILHNPVTIVFALATADIITGILKSILNENYKSNIFKKGLVTHSAIVIGLYLFQFVAGDFGLAPLVLPIASAFAAMYLSSLYENYKEMGGDVPTDVAKLLESNKNKTFIKGEDSPNSEETEAPKKVDVNEEEKAQEKIEK